jgi:hypothetical protein
LPVLPLEDRAWQDKNGRKDADLVVQAESPEATNAAMGGTPTYGGSFLWPVPAGGPSELSPFFLFLR